MASGSDPKEPQASPLREEIEKLVKGGQRQSEKDKKTSSPGAGPVESIREFVERRARKLGSNKNEN